MFKTSNQQFLNETALNQYIKRDALALINFVDCRFEEIDFLRRIINFCNFKNSKFNDLSFRKLAFGKSRLENCQIVNMVLTRAEFHSYKFINCDLSLSDFWEYEFVETTLKNSNLNFNNILWARSPYQFWQGWFLYVDSLLIQRLLNALGLSLS